MKRPRLGLGLFVAVIAAGIVAACSGGGGITPASHAGPQKQKLGYIHARVFVPKKHRDKVRKQQQALRAHGKRPHFLPSSTTEVEFRIMAVDGVGQNPGSPYSFTIYT